MLRNRPAQGWAARKQNFPLPGNACKEGRKAGRGGGARISTGRGSPQHGGCRVLLPSCPSPPPPGDSRPAPGEGLLRAPPKLTRGLPPAAAAPRNQGPPLRSALGPASHGAARSPRGPERPISSRLMLCCGGRAAVRGGEAGERAGTPPSWRLAAAPPRPALKMAALTSPRPGSRVRGGGGVGGGARRQRIPARGPSGGELSQTHQGVRNGIEVIAQPRRSAAGQALSLSPRIQSELLSLLLPGTGRRLDGRAQITAKCNCKHHSEKCALSLFCTAALSSCVSVCTAAHPKALTP